MIAARPACRLVANPVRLRAFEHCPVPRLFGGTVHALQQPEPRDGRHVICASLADLLARDLTVAHGDGLDLLFAARFRRLPAGAPRLICTSFF
jgi:hypothetical protein